MSLYNLFPFLNGYKSLLGAVGAFLAGLSGLLVAIAAVSALIGSLFTGDLGIMEFMQQIPTALESAGSAFLALLGYGIAHKLEKARRR